MSRAFLLVAAIGLISCDPDGEDTDIEEVFLAQGTIVSSEGDTGQVRIRKAFGMATNGQGAFYLSSNENATCDKIVEYLNHSDPYDPGDLFEGGHCNLTFSFDYDDSTGYDGVSYDKSDMTGIWSVNCAFDEGDFVLETRKGFKDYYWSGRWWQGDPTNYSATVTGNRDDNAVGFSFDMSEYTGNFIYEEFAEVLAEGQVVTGEVIEARWCPELVHTSLFDL